MKKYVVTDTSRTEYNGAFDMEGVSKTLDTYCGDGNWQNWNGFKLFVDTEGTIIKGIDPFIGRQLDDIQNLNSFQGMSIFNEYSNIANATKRALETDNNKIKSDGMERINSFINKSIAEAKLAKNSAWDSYV